MLPRLRTKFFPRPMFLDLAIEPANAPDLSPIYDPLKRTLQPPASLSFVLCPVFCEALVNAAV